MILCIRSTAHPHPSSGAARSARDTPDKQIFGAHVFADGVVGRLTIYKVSYVQKCCGKPVPPPRRSAICTKCYASCGKPFPPPVEVHSVLNVTLATQKRCWCNGKSIISSTSQLCGKPVPPPRRGALCTKSYGELIENRRWCNGKSIISDHTFGPIFTSENVVPTIRPSKIVCGKPVPPPP